VDAAPPASYLGRVSSPTDPSATPDFLNHGRPPVPDIVVPRGVQPFHLHDRPVRGRLVRLGPLADALLTRHDAHPVVTELAGQALALTAGLAAALKFRGSFSLQAKGDGAVPMLLADCTDGGALRGYARANEERLAALLDGGAAPGAAALLGQGYLAFTCDQGPQMDRYQGIVAIEGATLTEMTGAYFRTSEQIATHVHLACTRTDAGWRAAALILERVAGEGGIGADMDTDAQDEAWRTAVALAATLTDAELLDDALPGERLLHRLFALEGLALDRARALSYGCRCSRAKLAGVLAGFGEEDLDHMAEDGTITMTCEFCNLGFRFDRAELRGAEG
jgi:molecular chaperone Hsp33